MTTELKPLVLINANAGGVAKLGPKAVEALVSEALKDHAPPCEIFIGDTPALIGRAANSRRCKLVVCAGGDGTQAAIAGVLKNRRAALLPLPCGTLNLLCRDLGIPLVLEEALAAGLAGTIEAIDVGEANGRYFLNNVVFGVYAELAEKREDIRAAETAGELGSAIIAAADTLLRAGPTPFRVKMDRAVVELSTNYVAVSNNAVSGAANLIPKRDRLDRGLLSVYLTNAQHAGSFAAILASFATGSSEQAEGIAHHECRKCVVSADGATFNYSVDGEPFETTKPVALALHKRALKVLRPQRAAVSAAA